MIHAYVARGVLTDLVEGAAEDMLLTDESASDCIEKAEFNPLTSTITIHFHVGGTYDYSCSIATWTAYKMAPSKGAFFNKTWR